jgi:DNA-binding MarR family transcriptional regulator
VSESSIPALPCLCASLRRVSRAFTQRYDLVLRPLDLTITQFTILQALSRAGEVSQGRLGAILAMDSTTLTRTLEIMSGHGWIAKQPGTDRRQRRLRLSPAGRAEFQRALPHWEKAQEGVRAELGEERWNQLNMLIHQVTLAVAQ